MMCVVGVALAIGGQFYAWNVGLTAGVGSFFISVWLVGTAYLCLVLCLAEMSSAVPFSGGSFGCVNALLLFVK
jgi:amino acid transporter